jgi:hypothetical protein
MAALKTKTRARARKAVAPYCYDCRKSVRSLIEHRATATHKAAITTIRDTGPKGRSAYRPHAIVRSEADYDAWLEEQYLATLPPSIDDVFPTEIADPMPPAPPAERAYTPPPCERCGKTFRTDAGAAWHRDRNKYCEKWTARKSRAA